MKTMTRILASAALAVISAGTALAGETLDRVMEAGKPSFRPIRPIRRRVS